MQNIPQSLRLSGLPRIGPFSGGPRPPEDDPWPACLQAWLEHQGDSQGLQPNGDSDAHWHNVHVHLVALLGSAFRLGWSRRGWDMASQCYLESVPEALKKIEDSLACLGRPSRAWWSPALAERAGGSPDPEWSEEKCRERIISCIGDRRQPIIVVGLLGMPEPCLISGYEDRGRVLYGQSIFTEHGVHEGLCTVEPDGDFRVEDWFSRCDGIFEPGERTHEPDWADLDRVVLRQGLEILSSPRTHGFWTSLAASTCWAETLLDDSLFEGLEEDELRRRHSAHWVSAGVLAECRAWGSWYLHKAAARHPEAESLLLDLAVCMDMVHDLVWAIWEFTGSYPLSNASPPRFGDHSLRGRIAPLLRLVREEDAKALALIQKILKVWGEEAQPGLTLPNPPPLGYSVRLNPLMGCLEAFGKMVEDEVDYDDLMAVSGAAFRRFWHPNDGGSVDIQLLHPEPIRRAAALMAREYRLAESDRTEAVELFRKSLLVGRPAIAFGIAGPPEASLVTGITGDGAHLRVQTWFSHQEEPIEVDHWHETRDPHAPVLALAMGDRLRWHSPNPAGMVKKTLQFALDLGRSKDWPGVEGHSCGLAALRDWRRALAEGGDYTSDDPAVLEIRGMVHTDQVSMTYERVSAASWLVKVADWEPSARQPLLNAAALYHEISDLARKLQPWGILSFPESGMKLSDPETRAEICLALDEVERLETEALASLESALTALAQPVQSSGSSS